MSKKDDLIKQYNDAYNHIRKYPEVYIIRCNEYFKIGHSFDVYERLKGFETHNPYLLEVMYHAEVKNAKKIEKQLHKMFDVDKIKGEWFKLNSDSYNKAIYYIKKAERKWLKKMK